MVLFLSEEPQNQLKQNYLCPFPAGLKIYWAD